MQKLITIAGLPATLAAALLPRFADGMQLSALVRHGTKSDGSMNLRQQGIEVLDVDLDNSEAMARTCEGSSCVVSHFGRATNDDRNAEWFVACSRAHRRPALHFTGLCDGLRVLYWGGNPDQLMDFTTMHNTASLRLPQP